MGVSIDDLKNKAPDQVFIDVERALGNWRQASCRAKPRRTCSDRDSAPQ
jgi:hypothetical protein